MRKIEVLNLIDYMYWVNARLLQAAASLSQEQFTAPTSQTTRDLRATLVHELDVEWSWRLNLQGRLSEDTGELKPEDYPDVASLREHWQRDESEMRTWLAGLTDEELAKSVSSRLTNNRLPLWQFVMHIVIHATQQQADAATLLSLLGASPGEIGYLEFLKGT